MHRQSDVHSTARPSFRAAPSRHDTHERQERSERQLENQFELLVNELHDKPYEMLGKDMENSKEEEESEKVILRSGDEFEILGESFERLQAPTSFQNSDEKDEEASFSSLSACVAAHNVATFSQQNHPDFDKN